MSDKKYIIMVVEDEEILLKAVVKKFDTLGQDVVSCSGGKQALDYLESMDGFPDAIWLDYHLKDMNGLEFMHQLQQKDDWKKIPVFVISNSANDKTVHTMLGLGAQQYMLKAEHRLDNLCQTIIDFLSNKDE